MEIIGVIVFALWLLWLVSLGGQATDKVRSWFSKEEK